MCGPCPWLNKNWKIWKKRAQHGTSSGARWASSMFLRPEKDGTYGTIWCTRDVLSKEHKVHVLCLGCIRLMSADIGLLRYSGNIFQELPRYTKDHQAKVKWGWWNITLSTQESKFVRYHLYTPMTYVSLSRCLCNCRTSGNLSKNWASWNLRAVTKATYDSSYISHCQPLPLELRSPRSTGVRGEATGMVSLWQMSGHRAIQC